MLCWPPTMINTTVAIPCNASKIFVETLQETIETVQKELIPGEYRWQISRILISREKREILSHFSRETRKKRIETVQKE